MSFSAIKGQDRPVEIIKTYIENARMEGGYLFSGPEGIGKKMAALALAKALNCLEAKTDACGHCASCLKIENSRHPDVRVISGGEAQLKIEAIRQLQKDINLKAYEGIFKVYIIDNAHTLSAEAGNCLLKILEEPPQKSLIILVSDKPNLLFKTIISRCKIVKFLPLKREVLEEILKKEYKLDIQFAHFLAYFSEGRLGRALKLKDGGILAKKNNLIDKFVLSPRPDMESLAQQDKEDVRFSLNLLAAWFRDIYLLKAGLAEQEIINTDRREELTHSARGFSFFDLETIFTNLSAAIACLEKNVNTRLLLFNLRMELWKA
ncbi:MAG: DNA polymerase III subunit delta' [Candidatus Omnitrophica bacterium]|nr:DNA polymerase III subunit delta' [Candidatus Omnitrophota bacterium]MDD5027808.1 DNA polymerase III subunit delta' [Candidatus Omnitrophota bacterium]MDD5662207.1 DNA polymerase III subunit delta' [Candidatus Omnitrophota bacterium]